MMISGILWYDDDTHRPLAEKIAEAAQRYRERIGYEPTTCELNAAQAAAPRPAKAGARRAARTNANVLTAQPPALRLVPTEHLRPNYFFVGVSEGERLKRPIGWRDTFNDGNHAPATAPTAPIARTTPRPTSRPTAAPSQQRIASTS